jgi:eukaryotic-like serine/threonine-protein kinase
MRDTTQDGLSESASALDELTDDQKRRLTDILDRYLRALEGGYPPPREQLLSAHSDLAGPLSMYLDNLAELHDVAAAFGRPDAPPRDSAAGDEDERRLGDFVLVRELGRGGMGVVYEARQISLARRVALKVLPFAAVLESRQIARFKNEAQAAAQLHHPNIVPVYAVGVERGVHYYAMQFIEGQPLDRAIAELRPPSKSPRSDLATTETGSTNRHRDTPPRGARAAGVLPPGGSYLTRQWAHKQDYFRAVMRLGIQAAEALQAAHSYGIVHRDIKPSNLLLDHDGKLWVTDFGLARCQSDLALTRTGDVVGTRQYMSPEQAAGEAALVDHRTDVYSLGVTLYELVTLQPAFHGNDSHSPRWRVDSQDPVRPRALEPSLPADLETVLLKAMARERDDRYRTAQDLADDLGRVLEGKPTVARPPTLVDRAGKFARRHRRMVASAAAVVLLATFGLAVSNFLINREKTKAQADFARAERYFRQAQDTVDEFGSRFAERLAEVPGAEQARRELLDETLKYYERFVEQAGGDPALRADLAMTYGKIGTVNDQMGLTAEAIAAHGAAIALLEKLVAEQPETAEYDRRLAISRNNLALALGRAGRTDEARRAFQQAIAAQQKLVAEHPQADAYRAELALSHNNLGSLERETGRLDVARTTFHEAIRLAEQATRSAPRDGEAVRNLAVAYNNLAALDEGPNQADAVALYDKAAACQRAAVASRPGELTYRRELATTLNNLGAAQSKCGRIEPAAAAYREAIDLQKELVRIAPLERTYRRDLAVSYNNLGLAHAGLEQLDLADRCFRNALGFQEQLVAEQPQDLELLSSVGGMHNNLGIVLEQRGQIEAAAQSYAKAVEFQQTAHRRAPTVERYRTFLSKHYYNYGRALRLLGRCDEAAQAAIERKKLWPGDPERLFSVAEELALASKLAADGKSAADDAERCADLAVATLREAVAAGLHVPADLDRRESFIAVRRRPGFLELLQ